MTCILRAMITIIIYAKSNQSASRLIFMLLIANCEKKKTKQQNRNENNLKGKMSIELIFFSHLFAYKFKVFLMKNKHVLSIVH